MLLPGPHSIKAKHTNHIYKLLSAIMRQNILKFHDLALLQVIKNTHSIEVTMRG